MCSPKSTRRLQQEAAAWLKVSPRTIEFHRANIMQKLGARNAADLVRIVIGTISATTTATNALVDLVTVFHEVLA